MLKFNRKNLKMFTTQKNILVLYITILNWLQVFNFIFELASYNHCNNVLKIKLSLTCWVRKKVEIDMFYMTETLTILTFQILILCANVTYTSSYLTKNLQVKFFILSKLVAQALFWSVKCLISSIGSRRVLNFHNSIFKIMMSSLMGTDEVSY